MSTKMAVSRPWHFGSRGKLPQSEQIHMTRKHTWDICTCGQNSPVCRAGPPTDRLLRKFHTCQQGCQVQQPSTAHRFLGKFPTWHHGCQDIYQETQKGGVHHCQGIMRRQTTAETAELPTPECCSMPHWSPLASAAGDSALLDWGHRLPCRPLGSEDPSLQDAGDSLAHCAVSGTHRQRVWDLGSLFSMGVCYISLRLLECELDMNVYWCSTLSEPAFNKSWVNGIITVCDACLLLGAGLLSRQLAE